MSKDKTIVAGMAILKGTATAVATVLKKTFGKFDADGAELVDGRSMEPPVGYEPSKSIQEMIAEAVRGREIQRELHEAGAETFEEADDFNVGDDFDPTSPYEAIFEPITEAQVRDLERRGYIVIKNAEEPPPKPLATPQASPEPPKAAGAQPAPTPPVGAVNPS
jgi:hypothetical protein